MTPIRIDKYRQYLMDSGFHREKSEYLIEGFTNGFDIGYRGPVFRKHNSANIPLKIGNQEQLWSKLMKEVDKNRYAGPFDSVPYHQYMQSPIGLVPKAGNQTRLIFHLSYNFGNLECNNSLNYFTPKDWCKVKYRNLDHAIKNSLKLGRKLNRDSFKRKIGDEIISVDVAREVYQTLYYAKSDVQSAFRLVPILPGQRCWLIMMARNPSNGELAFFVDKCLPFGASISCSRFQLYSDSLRHIVEFATRRYQTVTNYLDDFLFVAEDEAKCNRMVRIFIRICEEIGCPLSFDKTEWASTKVIFLGLLINGVTYTVSIPVEKREKALSLLEYASNKKKVTIKFVQRLAGTLNFLNRAIVPGRTFTRCMYDKIKFKNKSGQKLKDYHHVNLGCDVLRDCQIWKTFLANLDTNPMQLCRPFVDIYGSQDSTTLNLYSDASLNKKLGYGAIFNDRWIAGLWGQDFIVKQQPSIQFLELYALVAAIITWGDLLKNSRISVYCDNQSVQYIVNSLTSKCANCMKLVRMLTIDNMRNNRRVFVKFVRTEDNVLADSLSRMDFRRFWKNAPKTMSLKQDQVHDSLWPVTKVWFGETDKLLNNIFSQNSNYRT